MTKDYYKILDITEYSNIEEIKNAYRYLARKWHPDIAGNSPDVIKKFKEINEAYDKVKKADYDTARRFYNYATSNKEKKQKENNNSSKEECYKNTYQESKKSNKKPFNFGWEEFIANKYRESQLKKEQSKLTPVRGEDIFSEVEISIFEAINGTTKIINMLQTSICPNCQGRKFVNGNVCKSCNGNGEQSTYKRFNVKIPAGIKDKSKIRLAGEGEKGSNGGHNGDLYLIINIKEPKNYKTEGLNILKTISITPYEAVLGGHIEIPTIKGAVSLKIAPNTRTGQKIRLSGCGIMQNNKVGDMIITVEIQIPKNHTNEEILLYQKLKEISSCKIREE